MGVSQLPLSPHRKRRFQMNKSVSPAELQFCMWRRRDMRESPCGFSFCERDSESSI
jgi:hypothetical protein